jgi:hypothetical protein
LGKKAAGSEHGRDKEYDDFHIFSPIRKCESLTDDIDLSVVSPRILIME